MATLYNGQGTLISPTKGAGARVAISAVANTSPIAITTSGAHGFNSGDSIEQEGTSSVADGQFQITKVDGTHYLLNGTTANGTATTGYAIDYELLPAVTIPANGELVDMGPLGEAIEGAFDPVPFLYRRAGKWRLYNQYDIIAGNVITTPFYSNPWSANANFTSTSFVALANATFTFESASDLPSGPPPVFASGDFIDVALSFTVNAITSTSTQNAYYQVGMGLVQGGTLYPTLLFQTVQAAYFAGGSGGALISPVTLTGSFYMASFAGTIPTAGLSFCIMARQDYKSASNDVELDLIGPLSGTILQWRPN